MTPSSSRRAPWLFNAGAPQALVLAAVYVALYVFLAWLSYVRPLLTLGITPWNPQTALSLALLTRYGWRWLPATIVATFLADRVLAGGSLSAPLTLVGATYVGCVYGALGHLLGRFRLSVPISAAREAARLVGTTALGTLIAAAGYVGLFVAAGVLPLTDAWSGIARYWVGDLNGTLALTPLLIYSANWREHWDVLRGHLWEIVAQFTVVAATLLIIFTLPVADQLRFFYLLFVPIIWIALRWSWPGAMLAVLTIQVGLLVAAEADIPTARFIDLQFLMLTLTLTALLLGAVVAERAGVLQRVAMREAEQRALLAMAPDAVLAVDASGKVRDANAAAVRLFGERAQARELARVEDLLPDLRPNSVEGRATLDGRREDGRSFPAEVAWARLDAPADRGFLLIVRDATDRRRSEEQLRERDSALARAMRFAVAGELASSLAHELNQPITALVSYLRASEIMAARTTGGDERLKATLDKAAGEAIRASEVLRRLRHFYQGGALKRETVDVPSVCDAVVGAFQDRMRRADAALMVAVDPALPTLEGDATQLEIVLHNLLANALDAVAQQAAPRRITLHASCAEGIVTLRIEDSGPGVLPEVAEKLFEPFVTSKPDGMGLGLAISRSLIRARGGELSFASDAALGGAAFTVRLPVETTSSTLLV